MNNINKKNVGQRIKNIRVKRKETLEEFANQIQKETDFTLKTTKSNVSKWEKGLNIPNDISLQAISNLGDVSTEYILTGDEFAHIFTNQHLLDSREKNISLLSNALADSITIENTQENLVIEENFRYFIPILSYLKEKDEIEPMRSLRNNILMLSELYKDLIFFEKIKLKDDEELDFSAYLDYKKNPILKDKKQTEKDFEKLIADINSNLESLFYKKLKQFHSHD